MPNSTLYVSPTGSGDRSGSSWANAAAITSIDTVIKKAGADGTVLLAADKGAYNVSAPINIWSGGTDGHPVTIKGVSSATGASMDAVINGTRPAVYKAGNPAGNELFKLLSGGNITFEGMTINNTGTAFRVGADMKNVTIQNVDANNVQRFFEDSASGSAKTASIDGLTIRDVNVQGFSKGVIRTQYDTKNVLIENVHGDSQRQDGDDFAMGVMLAGTTHNVVIRKTSMDNAINTNGRYHNGDGFASEMGVYNVLMEDVSAHGNSDGGFDLKSTSTTLIRAFSEGNNKNFRLWGETTLIDSIAANPKYSGGSGGQTQIDIPAATARVRIVDSQIVDSSAATYVISLTGGVTLENTKVIYAEGAHKTFGDAVLALKGTSSMSAVAAGSAVVIDMSILSADILPGAGASPQADVPPPVVIPAYVAPTVSIAPMAAAVSEGNVGASTGVTFTITRSGDLTKDAAVNYAVAGTSVDGVDAADLASGTLPTGQATFAAGQATASIAIAVKGDATVEANEGLTVTLTGVSNATLGTAVATTTILNDDVAPVSPIVRGSGVNQTLSGPAWHNEFLFDTAATTGKSTIATFQRSDILVTTQALDDPNKDGIVVQSAKNGVFSLDKAGDTVTIASATNGLRFLGKDGDGYLYGDANVRPKWATEGTVGNDTFKADGNVSKELFFFDTANGHGWGADAITNFGEKDAIATTTKLADVAVGGRVNAVDGLFLLAGAQGAPADTGIAGAGGSLHIDRSWDGAAVATLEFDGEVVRGDTHYYIYSMVGSVGGLGNVYL